MLQYLQLITVIINYEHPTEDLFDWLLQALVSDHLNTDVNHSDLKQQYVHVLTEREEMIQMQGDVQRDSTNIVIYPQYPGIKFLL